MCLCIYFVLKVKSIFYAPAQAACTASAMHGSEYQIDAESERVQLGYIDGRVPAQRIRPALVSLSRIRKNLRCLYVRTKQHAIIYLLYACIYDPATLLVHVYLGFINPFYLYTCTLCPIDRSIPKQHNNKTYQEKRKPKLAS